MGDIRGTRCNATGVSSSLTINGTQTPKLGPRCRAIEAPREPHEGSASAFDDERRPFISHRVDNARARSGP